MRARPGEQYQPGGNPPAGPIRPSAGTAPTAFTLVELLVVIGIIAVLIGMLLPALVAARKNAMAVKCTANVRTICAAILCYASDSKGVFPPNGGLLPGMFWHEPERVGGYLSRGGRGSAVLACPADQDAERSYAMNVWASSVVDNPKRMDELGGRWKATVHDGSRMILVTEAWSGNRRTTIAPWSAPATVGFAGSTPGQKFGADGGICPPMPAGRWGTVMSELPYWRHRKSGGVSIKDPVGRVNIGYADGHVALKSEWELADFQTGRSTLDSLWTLQDAERNQCGVEVIVAN